MNNIAIALIKLYSFLLSPLMGNQCRFHPSCSNYALLAYQQYNFFQATYLMMRRLLRCQPFAKGGIDYPKLKVSKKSEKF